MERTSDEPGSLVGEPSCDRGCQRLRRVAALLLLAEGYAALNLSCRVQPSLAKLSQLKTALFWLGLRQREIASPVRESTEIGNATGRREAARG